MVRRNRKYLAGIFITLAVIILCLLGSASAQKNNVVYTNQVNPPPPGVIPPHHSYDADLTWAADVCSSIRLPVPLGSELEWRSILDPNQDAEAEGHLVAVSGTVVYDPDPGESGYCQGSNGSVCPGEAISCSSDSDCDRCNGRCDLGQGPSCTGGTCPFFDGPQVGQAAGDLPIACTSDAQCAGVCGGTCVAKGRSRDDLPMTHPFGFDYDAQIAPDPDYVSLLSSGNVESTHVDLQKDGSGRIAVDTFDAEVYPFLHATAGITLGWCSNDFKQRCTVDNAADVCGEGRCEGLVAGFGLKADDLHGTLGLETDHDLLPESYQPQDGDRAAIFGRWIVDCGHGNTNQVAGFHTEIHPPLLIATGRSIGAGAFGALCSDDQTCSSLIGRPFLVSQNFGDGPFVKHIVHEVEKLGCSAIIGPFLQGVIAVEGVLAGLPDCSLGSDPFCVCNDGIICSLCELGSCGNLNDDPPLGVPCTTQLEERPNIGGPPFTGKQDMLYFLQPANGRQNPGDRMVAKWHVTARNGVTVALSGAGDAGLVVHVIMHQDAYNPPAPPPKQDWTVHSGELNPDFSIKWFGEFLGAVALNAPVQAAIINRGLFTDRYQAPQVPTNEGSPTVSFADQLNGATQAAQDIDDGQAFPVSGRINVGWFRCNPGGPYVAECQGANTAVALTSIGTRDPDNNPLTLTWNGGFVEGSATGPNPVVEFVGTGTFPVTLNAADSEMSTTCSTTVKVQDTTPPLIDITQPMPTTYTHSSVLKLDYSVTDACTGVASFTPTMDGATTLHEHGLQSGQVIPLLTELKLGTHQFSIGAVDVAGNADTKTVSFTIIVTPDSIKDDVNQFLAMGAIKNAGEANSLLAKLDAGASARARGECDTSANNYSAFINELNAQSGKGVDANAAAIMIADAQYLITHCP